jgi:hypothetical protein
VETRMTAAKTLSAAILDHENGSPHENHYRL